MKFTSGMFRSTLRRPQVIWVLTPNFFSLAPAHELVVNVGLFRKAELLLLRIFFKNKEKN